MPWRSALQSHSTSELDKKCLNGFKSVNSIGKNNMIWQTIPYGDYLFSKAEFHEIIVTVMLNRLEVVVTPSPN